MKNTLITISFLGLSLSGFSLPAIAESPHQIHQTIRLTGEELIPIKLAPGYGVNISFASLGEYVQHTWLDNPAFVTLDANIGASGGDAQGVEVLHLKRIERLELQGLPNTVKTLLTVITKSKDGGKTNTYLFEIIPVAKRGPVLIDFARAEPEAEGCRISATRAEINLKENEAFKDTLRGGIQNAILQRYIHSNSPLIAKVEEFLAALDCGMYKNQAAAKIGIPLEVIEKLERLGSPIPENDSIPAENVNPNNSEENNHATETGNIESLPIINRKSPVSPDGNSETKEIEETPTPDKSTD